MDPSQGPVPSSWRSAGMSVDSNTPLDPRVQVELEKLNTATDNINKFEVELDEAKCDFKKFLAESVEKIKQSAHKLGNSIEAAKPYYEARLYAAQLSKEAQQAQQNHDKAKSVHAAAKEMVYLAEQGLGEKSTLDTACQEMLSHAASRVNQSQIECTETRNLLKITELKLEVANSRVSKLQAQLKSAIKASSYNIRRKLLFMNLLAYQHDLLILPYYETRANYNGLLKAQREKITNLENKVSDAKMTYNEALKNLEQISEEIHRMRQEKCDSYNLNISFDESNSSPCNNKMTFPNQIDSCDEYLDFPPKLSTKSSPVRQKRFDQHDCPHLLRDFEHRNDFLISCVSDLAASKNDDRSASTADSVFSPCQDPSSSSAVSNLADDIEQWTEIRLSDSSSSGYSHQSVIDDRTPPGSDTSSSEDNRKVTCTTVFNVDAIEDAQNKKKSGEGIGTWITRSSSFKSSGRRQSLDILIDASDRVKDVFASSFQKVGRSLERRNSESEVNNDNGEFFLFSRNEKDTLSDEQVENLLLNEDDNMLKNIGDISK